MQNASWLDGTRAGRREDRVCSPASRGVRRDSVSLPHPPPRGQQVCRKELGDSKPGMEAFQGRVPIMMWQLLDPAAHDLGIPEAQREWMRIIITRISKHSDVTNKPECLPRAARPHRTHPEYSAGVGGEYTSKCSRGRSPCTAPQMDGVGGRPLRGRVPASLQPHRDSASRVSKMVVGTITIL